MKPYLALTLGIVATCLSGCLAAERHARQDDTYCQGLGAKPGTQLYVQCRLQADNNRSARYQAAAQAQMAGQMTYQNIYTNMTRNRF